MRIQSYEKLNQVASGRGHGRRTPENLRGVPSSNKTDDRVALEGRSGLVGKALSAAAEERELRVAKLATLFDEGRYRVDPYEVSRAIVDEAIETGRAAR